MKSEYSMVQECCISYRVAELGDGSVEIKIHVDRRFRDLWIVKLSELKASDQEIKEMEVLS